MNDSSEIKELDSPLIEQIETAFGPPDAETVERLPNEEEWVKKQAAGRVHIIPKGASMDDKRIMLGLQTTDTDLFQNFNEAAGVVTSKWNSVNQTDSQATTGLTLWEFYNKPDIPEEEILERVKQEMINIANS